MSRVGIRDGMGVLCSMSLPDGKGGAKRRKDGSDGLRVV
jgi:hypothetical protein